MFFRASNRKHAHDPRADCERRGEPRTFDAIERDDAAKSVLLRSLQQEIGGGGARTGKFRPHAGVVGGQRSIREVRPIASRAGIKSFRSTRLDAKVNLVGIARFEPFDVGAKPNSTV